MYERIDNLISYIKGLFTMIFNPSMLILCSTTVPNLSCRNECMRAYIFSYIQGLFTMIFNSSMFSLCSDKVFKNTYLAISKDYFL